MDEYRKHVSDIHAPESLINNTLEQIHVRQQAEMKNSSVKKRKKSNIIKFAVPALSAAAAVMILVTQMPDRNNLIYNTVPDMAFRAGDISISFGAFTESDEISAEKYSEYLGVEVDGLFEGMEFTEADIEVSYDEKGGLITDDEAELNYRSSERRIVMECSMTKNMIPEVMEQGEVSCIDGNDVWLAVNEQENILMAAGEVNGISYYIHAEGMNQKQFEKILKKFFEKM